MNRTNILCFFLMTLLLHACSPKIYGTVELVDSSFEPVPSAGESPEGTVVNMINITTTLENASQAVLVTADGKYESPEKQILPGVYKIEASRIGYRTDTQTVQITKYGRKKVNFTLRKIPESARTSIEGLSSDEEKIINPGEVNIQPPLM